MAPSHASSTPVHAFTWSPDSKEIAVGYADSVRVYHAKTLKEVRAFDAAGGTAIAWSKDGKALALAVAREVRDMTPVDNPPVPPQVVAVKITVRLLDAQTGKELRRIDGFPDNLPVVSLAFRPDGEQLLCGAGFLPGSFPILNVLQPAKDAKSLRVIPLKANAPAAPSMWKESKVLDLTGWLGGSVAYSADGKTLYVGGTDGHVSCLRRGHV